MFRQKDGRPGRKSRAMGVMASMLMLTGSIPATLAVTTVAEIATAKPAAAETLTIENSGGDAAEPKPSVKGAPAPTSGGKVKATIDPTLDAVENFPFEAWFYEHTKTGILPTPVGMSGNYLTYDFVAGRCGGVSADRTYPYNGNAIPVPNSPSEAGTKRLVWVKWNTRVELRSETHSYVEEIPEVIIDPVTGETTTYTKTISLPGETISWREYFYTYSCQYQTSPRWTANDCVAYGETVINGPFDQSWRPMTSVEAGGTNTRVPNPALGAIDVYGMPRQEWSNSLGKDMKAAGFNVKTDAPNLPIVWKDCVPTSANTFDASLDDDISSLGRYQAIIKQWWVKVWFQKFDDANWPNIYKSIANAAGGTNSLIRNIGGTGYYIRDIGTPAMRTTYDYFKIICADGGSAMGRVAVKYVARGTTAGRDGVSWGDSSPNYYTWNCGAEPGAGVPDSSTATDTSTTSDDFLQCATYTTPSGTVRVGNKVAAPLQSVTQVVRGEVRNVKNKGGVYYISAAADPIHATWQQIRINTRDGRDINSAGKNVVWDYTYRLADWSSPLLKGTDKNALTQPYHGWEDKTADSVLAAETPPDTKWEPDKFYEYKTLAYTYSTKPYTYHIEYDYAPYTYHTETRQTGTEPYACGSTEVQCGTEEYKCGGDYWKVDSGEATRYWWVNGGQGGYACPSGWWLSGTTCYTNTYVPPTYCTRPIYCPQTIWCSRPTYGTFSVKDAPPAGFFDNGSSYQRNRTVKDPAPAGYYDDGAQYKMLNPPPYGYTDLGNGVYTSIDKLNTSGKTGGIAFDKWRKWPSNDGLNPCTINLSDYSSKATGTRSTYCGDNVTDSMRGAYFRFFMSSTAGSRGWQTTPWARVTADMSTSFRQIKGFTMNPDGTLTLEWTDTTTELVRQSYECPAQPLRVMIERVVGG